MTWRAHAFGLSLSADFDMPGFPTTTSTPGTAHRCGLVVPLADESWPATRAVRLFELADEEGRVLSAVDFDADAGARVWGLERGTFFVESDGSRVGCHPDEVEPWQWRRFLVGQVLPLAALLQGFEILHASAVVLGDGALVLVGGSQAGKSSVAAHLTLRGASLLADDVVSLQRREDDALGYPGTPMIGLRHAEASRLSGDELERLGKVVADRATELLIAPNRMASRPYPVRSVYFLNRSTEDGPLAFEAVPDPRYLLASSFNDVLRTKERLVSMLDIHSALSKSARVARVNVPPTATAADVAAAVEHHHRATAGPS